MLFDATGSMIYGENPASWETGDLMDPKASSNDAHTRRRDAITCLLAYAAEKQNNEQTYLGSRPGCCSERLSYGYGYDLEQRGLDIATWTP